MVHLKTFLLLAASTLFLNSHCSTQPLPSIAGSIQLSEGWKPVIYLVQPRNFAEIASNYNGLVLDSAVVTKDGKFSFAKVSLPMDQTLLQLCIQKTGNRFPNQLIDEDPLLSNYMPVVITKGETVQVTAVAKNFQASFELKRPSAANLALLRLRDLRHKTFNQERNLLTSGDHNSEVALMQYEDALLRYRRPLMAFADTTQNLWAALVATRWVSVTNDYERVPEFLFRQCTRWSKEVPGQAMTTQLCTLGNRENLPVLTGDPFPNAALPMLQGDTVLLYSQLGKQMTIVDLWASWCAPCRKENREVLEPLWKQYQSQGLQILGYSIDSSPAAWKAAIVKDGAVWPHASHLQGDDAPLLATLRISTIPANFILDAQGKVIAKNLHGEALRTFVKSQISQ